MGVEGTRFLEGHLVITPLGFVPIRLASSCAALFWFSPSSTVTVTRLLFSSQPLGSCFCRGSGHIFHTHLRSVRPPFLPPLFFPCEFELSSVFPNRALSPGLPPLRRPRLVYPTRLPLFHPSSNTMLSRSPSSPTPASQCPHPEILRLVNFSRPLFSHNPYASSVPRWRC